MFRSLNCSSRFVKSLTYGEESSPPLLLLLFMSTVIRGLALLFTLPRIMLTTGVLLLLLLPSKLLAGEYRFGKESPCRRP